MTPVYGRDHTGKGSLIVGHLSSIAMDLRDELLVQLAWSSFGSEKDCSSSLEICLA